jgi:hypothetical protein
MHCDNCICNKCKNLGECDACNYCTRVAVSECDDFENKTEDKSI